MIDDRLSASLSLSLTDREITITIIIGNINSGRGKPGTDFLEFVESPPPRHLERVCQSVCAISSLSAYEIKLQLQYLPCSAFEFPHKLNTTTAIYVDDELNPHLFFVSIAHSSRLGR